MHENLNPTQKQVLRILEDHLLTTPSQLTPEARLVEDFGQDSLDNATLITILERNFDVQITDEQTEKVKTIQDVLDIFKDHK